MKDKLEEIFGKAFYSEKDSDRIIYGTDASKLRGKALGVVWPDCIEQLQKLIHLARRRKILLTIRGGASEIRGGAVPDESLVVDMSRMNKVLEIGDDFITVQGGANIDFVNAHLKHKQIPVIPWNHKVATIGGMVAVNSFGINKSKGRIEDYVLELEVMDGNGKYMLVKGDKIKDYIGKEGITGIICKAKLRIIKKKKGSYSIFNYNSVSSLIDKFLELRENLSVESIDFFDEYTSSTIDLEYKFHLIVKYKDDSGKIVALDEIANMNKIFDIVHVLLVLNKYKNIETLKIKSKDLAWLMHWAKKNGIPCYGNFNVGIITFHCRDKHRLELINKVAKKLNAKKGYGLPIGRKNKDYFNDEERRQLYELKLQRDGSKILNRGVYFDMV